MPMPYRERPSLFAGGTAMRKAHFQLGIRHAYGIVCNAQHAPILIGVIGNRYLEWQAFFFKSLVENRLVVEIRLR